MNVAPNQQSPFPPGVPQPQQQLESMDDVAVAQYLGQNGPAPAYQPGSDISSATGDQWPNVPAQQSTKQTLRGALGHIFKNFATGMGEAMSNYAGNGTESDLRRAQAQYYRTESQALAQQSKPVMLMDPATGKPMYGPDGSLMLGTLAHQKELNDTFKVTGGTVPVPAALAQSLGFPELAGHPISANSLTAIIKSQDRGETLEQEIARLAQLSIRGGKDPNQDPAIQQLLSLRGAVKDKSPNASELDNQYLNLYAKKLSKQPVTPAEDAWMQAYEHKATLQLQARHELEPPQARGTWLPMTTNDGKQAFFNPTTGETKYAPEGMTKADPQADERLYKDVIAPAQQKEQAYQMFQNAYNDFKKGAQTGAPSMVALSNHLATTFGNVKGARITKDMIEHHLGARSISDDALVAVQKFTNGDVLSPQQWDAFKSLIGDSRNIAWQTAKTEAHARGLDANLAKRLPADLQGNAAGGLTIVRDPQSGRITGVQ